MNNGVLVPEEIKDDEPCLRCIYHPFHIDSKGKIRREALLPPNNRNDVSLFRRNYMSVEKCIAHGKKANALMQKTLVAIGSITLNDVLENNDWALTLLESHTPNDTSTSAMIHSSPMTKNNDEYVYVNVEKVYSEDPRIDLPAHADMRYNSNFVGGIVKTRMRQYASQLVERMEIVPLEIQDC